MTTLLNVAERAGGALFDLEYYIARESIGHVGHDSTALKRPVGRWVQNSYQL